MNMLTLKIDPIQSQLAKMGISYNAFQKLTAITEEVINQQGYQAVAFRPIIEPDLDLAELMIEFSDINPPQAFMLNQAISEAILTAGEEDEIFANEVRKITTYCTLKAESA